MCIGTQTHYANRMMVIRYPSCLAVIAVCVMSVNGIRLSSFRGKCNIMLKVDYEPEFCIACKDNLHRDLYFSSDIKPLKAIK